MQKIDCVAAGGLRTPWKKLRGLEFAGVQKLLNHNARWAKILPKNKSALRGISKPNGSNWSSHPLARSKKMVFSWNSQTTLHREQPIQVLDAASVDNANEVLLRFSGPPPSKAARSRSFSRSPCRDFGNLALGSANHFFASAGRSLSRVGAERETQQHM